MKKSFPGLLLTALLLTGCGDADSTAGSAPMAAPTAAAAATAPATFALTQIGPNGVGYLADPQPIRRPSAAIGDEYLSGTTKAIVNCPYPLQAQGCGWSALTVDAADLQAQIQAAGDTITNFQNINVFQADDGTWHAAVTIGVASAAHPDHWTVIAHAHPESVPADGSPPLAWDADTVLVGSFSQPQAGNYDAKYYEEAGALYLLYVANQQSAPALRNAIVLQALQSFTQLTAAAPATLLATGDRYGEVTSENFGATQAKLVEAPWITVLNGEHALIYSTGSYLTAGYKAGVAWSDTLLPPVNGTYRKVLLADPQNVWGSANGHDVDYLVQSQHAAWPNFVGANVVGPGVAALRQGSGGAWWLYFNGFAPGDTPTNANGQVDATHRRLFAVQMQVNVPSGQSTASVSDAQLATWLVPVQH